MDWLRFHGLGRALVWAAVLVTSGLIAALPLAAPATAQAIAEAVPSGAAEGGPRRWEVTGVTTSLNMRDAPDGGGAVLTELPLGTLLDNLGCVRGEARVWCDVQPTGGGPRGYAAAEFLAPAVGPDGQVAMGYDDSAYRAGLGTFDATGEIPCRIGEAPMTACPFAVARGTGGDATIVITRPDAGERAIFFAAGRFLGADTSEADPGTVSVVRDGDTSVIRAGDEIYRVPDAVVLGG